MKLYNTTRLKLVPIITMLLVLIGLLTGMAMLSQNGGSQPSSYLKVVHQSSDGSQMAPVIGITADKGLRVLDIESGSTAERAGIQPGDILQRVNNVSLAPAIDVAGVWNIIYQVRSVIDQSGGQTLPLVVSRNGRLLTLAVLPAANPHPNQPTPTAVPQEQVYF